ncbi:MAG: extracellular solute-binding protein [Treponema sp.]|jgi:spermidine/putrescine transport system substrate-binding protein|nr:extracellular solute-binding protein [Treponema sp.]
MKEKTEEILISGAVQNGKPAANAAAGLRAGLAVFALAVFCTVTLGGCAKKEKLYIYNWTYYTPDSVIEKFEKEYNVSVIYDEFASNEDMFAKLKAGGSGYDIVFPSADYVSIMIQQNMLEKIDRTKIPNLKNIDPAVLRQADYDPDMNYSVPYYFGAAGIAVNTTHVTDFEESWSIFGREDLKGRMTMLDDMREVMGDALAYLGYSVNSTEPAKIEEARKLINNSWKPNLVKFDAEAFGKGYANGDFWVVQGYPEVVFEEIADNQQLIAKTVFFIPAEGGPSYIDSMCILKGSKNIDVAHKFIDFIHRPEIYAEFADIFGFPATANIPARDYKTGDSWYSEADLANVEVKKDIGDKLELYNEAWFNSIRIDK